MFWLDPSATRKSFHSGQVIWKEKQMNQWDEEKCDTTRRSDVLSRWRNDEDEFGWLMINDEKMNDEQQEKDSTATEKNQ